MPVHALAEVPRDGSRFVCRKVRLCQRSGAMAVSAILLVSCALAPLTGSPFPSPGGSQPPPTSSASSPEPSLVASPGLTPADDDPSAPDPNHAGIGHADTDPAR